MPIETFNRFEKDNHLQPVLEKKKFDSLHGWDFGWELLEPINIADGEEAEKELAKRLSPGQKALYFFWYLDAQVTNGGFIQFYWNDYRQYIPAIIEGLKLIGDIAMLELVNKADNEYLIHESKFILQRKKDNWEPLYDNLKDFNKYDETYYDLHDKTMNLIETYARQNPTEFVKLE